MKEILIFVLIPLNLFTSDMLAQTSSQGFPNSCNEKIYSYVGFMPKPEFKTSKVQDALDGELKLDPNKYKKASVTFKYVINCKGKSVDFMVAEQENVSDDLISNMTVILEREMLWQAAQHGVPTVDVFSVLEVKIKKGAFSIKTSDLK